MTVFPVIIDSRPAYLGNGEVPSSLLLAPLGTGTLLQDIRTGLTAATGETLTVVPTFDPSPEYVRAIRESEPAVDSVVPVAAFGSTLSRFEPSDWLLIVDPRCFAPEGLGLDALLQATSKPGWATHVVALETSSEGTKEYIQLDTDGRVRRIQRYYEGVTWLHASGVFCSLVPATCPLLIADLSNLAPWDLRKALAAVGVPGSDIRYPGEAIDLTEEFGLLSVAERRVLETTALPPPVGYTALNEGVYVGPNCTIDPGARIFGPALVQGDVTIEADAIVIGPVLLGTGARIRRNSVVAQSLVMPGAVVGPEGVFRHCVVSRTRRNESPAWQQIRPSRIPIYQPAASNGMPHDSASGNGASTDSHGRSVYPRFKRVLEAVFALLGLITLSPLLLVTAVLIKATSRGSVLYGSQREGRGGVVFRCWKFRTMIEGAHSQQRSLYAKSKVDGPQFKLDSDPRETPVGAILRRTNIDELPQLINVLLGHMSLIGPRPSPFRENQICVPWRRARLSVRPGITGLWQICRHERSVGDFHQWIYYDTLYVRHLSLWLDVKILIATLLTLGGRWSVPLPWLISPTKLHDAGEALSIPMRRPALQPLSDRNVPWRVA